MQIVIYLKKHESLQVNDKMLFVSKDNLRVKHMEYLSIRNILIPKYICVINNEKFVHK